MSEPAPTYEAAWGSSGDPVLDALVLELEAAGLLVSVEYQGRVASIATVVKQVEVGQATPLGVVAISTSFDNDDPNVLTGLAHGCPSFDACGIWDGLGPCGAWIGSGNQPLILALGNRGEPASFLASKIMGMLDVLAQVAK